MPTDTDKTKDRLFAAAIKIFAEKGFQAATVRAICREAEANVAAVNYHFGDKEHLYRQVVETIFKISAQYRTPYLGADASKEERLRTYIKAEFEEVLPSMQDQFEPQQCLAMSTIFLMEIARPTAVLDFLVDSYILPDCLELFDIVRAFVGPDVPEESVRFCAGSIISQVLHYFYSRPILERIEGTPDFTNPVVRDLAVEHVFQFSLGGLNHLKALHEGKNDHE